MAKAITARKHMSGFTLIEIMIVVVIMSIIMTVAIPGYRGYVMRANRADATTALLRIAAAQERFYLQNGTYADDDLLGEDPPAGLGIANTEREYYDLAIDQASATSYVISATAKADGAQNNDSECTTFRLTDRGERESAPGAIKTCWK